jgi:hypothetical protein
MRSILLSSQWASPTIWMALSIFAGGLFSAAAFGQADPPLEETQIGLANRFLIIIIAAVIALISRAVLLRRLNKLMLSEAKKPGEFAKEQAPKPETKARQELRLVEKNFESADKEKESRRERLMTRARSGINRLFFTQLVIAVAYAAGFYLVVQWEFPGYIEFLASRSEDLEAIRRPILNYQIYEWLIIFLFAWTAIQFGANRYYFSGWGKGRFGFLAQGFWGQAIAIMVLLYTLGFTLTLFSFVLLVPVALHLFLWWHLKRSGRQRSNTKLLILRVFLLKKTSDFTFKRLVKAWKHFGNYFTAADPSFYKVTWKRRFRHTFPVYIIAVFFIYTLLEDTTRGTGAGDIFGGFIFLLIIGNIIWILNSRSRMKRLFMGSPDSLAKRLGTVEHNPVKVDNTFRELPVMCYDNTWRQAVDGMIGTADVVLMDLRGFSEKNVSSAYEINVLFDTVPANRIVFMAYEEAIPLVKRTINEQWEMLAEDSPNLDTKDPYTTLYTVTRENRKDMQGILATLLDSAGQDEQINSGAE